MAIINGTSGPDPLDGTSGDDEIYGFAGNDVLRGLLGNDYIEGGADNDFIDGGAGFDTMLGGAGDDIFVVDSLYDVTTEAVGEGNDIVYAYNDYELQAGSEIERLSSVDWRFTSALQLTGNEFANLIEGNRGDNYLNGGGGDDVLVGFEGDDVYVVDSAGDAVIEDGDLTSEFGRTHGGRDTVLTTVSYALAAGSFVEELAASDIAGTAALFLTGNELANVLRGNAGANTLYDGGGADTMYGYGGDDTYVVSDTSSQIVELGGQGNDIVYALGSYTLGAAVSVERLSTIDWTSTAAVTLIGNELANLIEGNAGDNILEGGGGGDVLAGLGGDDTYFIRGNGNQAVIEANGGGTDYVIAFVDYTLNEDSYVEELRAGTGGVTLRGNAFANTLRGVGGDDVLDGGDGADIMIGAVGNDAFVVNDPGDQIFEVQGGYNIVYTTISYTLAPGSMLSALSAIDYSLNLGLTLTGNEHGNGIFGDAGVNLINGLLGSDDLYGKGGADTFAFTTALSASQNVDSLKDFEVGVDKIALDDAIFMGLSPGALPASVFALGSAGDADDRIVYDSVTGRIFYDSNGSAAGGSTLFALVTPGTALTASDFTVI